MRRGVGVPPPQESCETRQTQQAEPAPVGAVVGSGRRHGGDGSARGVSVVPVVVTVVEPPPVVEPPVVPLVASAKPALAVKSVTVTRGTRKCLAIMSVSNS